MSQGHSERATTALQKLSERDLAMASLALWAHHRDTDGIDVSEITVKTDGAIENLKRKVELAPAYTDGSTVWYGTQFAKWSLEEQMAVCAHEIMHIALRHVNRGKKLSLRLGNLYDGQVFNIATDAIINETLRLAGYRLPGTGVFLVDLFREAFNEDVRAEDAISQWDAEKLYMRIMNERSQTGKQGQAPQSGQGSKSQPGENSQSGTSKNDKGNKDNDSDNADTGKSTAQKVKDFAEGKEHHDDLDTSRPISPDDSQKDSEWAQHMERALRQAAQRQSGTGLGAIGHKIADIPKSRTPWELILRRMINKAVTRSPRPSYTSPARQWIGMEDDANRRGLPTPAFQPGYINRNAHPRVAIGIDVSGSIGDQELEIFCGEISAIGRKTGTEIHVIVFDTRVISEHKVDTADLEREIRNIDFARGGGTSFVEVIDRAMTLDPSIIVVLTDLCGPFGDDPRIPVIWASPDERAPDPPFGRVIHLGA